eukprot:38434-Chlamydomonas_euryale.AAC.1
MLHGLMQPPPPPVQSELRCAMPSGVAHTHDTCNGERPIRCWRSQHPRPHPPTRRRARTKTRVLWPLGALKPWSNALTRWETTPTPVSPPPPPPQPLIHHHLIDLVAHATP